MQEIILLSLALVAFAVALMGLIFWVARTIKRYDIVDVYWGPLVLALIVAPSLYMSTFLWAGWLIAILIGIWAIRLTYHLMKRFAPHTSQDARYTALIRRFPKSARGWHIFLRMYVPQAIAAVLLAVVGIVAVNYATPSGWFFVGIAVWILGFNIEVKADQQLANFLAEKHNKNYICDEGLWQYSRHPNYFGESLMWWGVWLTTISTPYWAVALLGPVTITGLLLFVSGVPLAEANLAKKRGYKAYKKRTSPFVPLPQRDI